MLSRVSYESLKKAAIYGAVLSVSGCSVLYYLIQRKGLPYNPCSHSHGSHKVTHATVVVNATQHSITCMSVGLTVLGRQRQSVL